MSSNWLLELAVAPAEIDTARPTVLMIGVVVTCDCQDDGKLGLVRSCKTALPAESVNSSCAVPLSVRATATLLDDENVGSKGLVSHSLFSGFAGHKKAR